MFSNLRSCIRGNFLLHYYIHVIFVQLTFAGDRVSPGAVFSTRVYTVSARQVVAERTRHFTRVVVHFLARCTRCIIV